MQSNEYVAKQISPENKRYKEEVQMIEKNDEYDDVFCVDSIDTSNEKQCKIGGREVWNKLKTGNVQTISREKKIR